MWVDRQPMLDGGIIDSIPVMRAIETGHPYNVVVLTRNRGYRDTSRDIKIPKYIYRRFPRLRSGPEQASGSLQCPTRPRRTTEDEGRILVIRPIKPSK